VSTKLCLWFGLISGAFVGLLLGFLHGVVCCTPPQPPSWAQLALDGIIVAVITVCICAAFACLLSRLAILPVFVLALLIGVLIGILLGPLAYHLPHPLLALLLCGILGALIGLLMCRLVCRSERFLAAEAPR
jgi:xanthosine utilization system XapX-like protein